MTWPSAPRLPLDRELLVHLLESCLPGEAIEVVEETGSTNADLANRVKSGRAALLVAEEQSAGRGRLDRSWIAPKGSGLLFSLYWPAPLLMAPLLMGVAAAHASPARELLIAEIVKLFAELTTLEDLEFLERYKTHSSTIGSRVRAEMVKGESIVGTAIGINATGALIISNDAGAHVLTAGDVFHLR